MSEVPRYRSGKAFVLGLAAALPEAFAGRDLEAEYGYGLQYPQPWDPPDYDGWLGTIALDDAVAWISEYAVECDGRAETSAVRSGGEKYLRPFFDYMESVIHEGADYPAIHWIDTELFKAVPWTEAVIEYLGPQTVRRLRIAQDRYGDDGITNVGRWRAPE